MNEKTVTISIKFSTLQLVGAALRELPYKLVAEPILEIDMEVQKYLKNQEVPNVEKDSG